MKFVNLAKTSFADVVTGTIRTSRFCSRCQADSKGEELLRKD